MNQIIWVLINCNSKKEAETIGRSILKMRLISCFDVIPRYLAVYFWPPKTGKIETSHGAILILETSPNKYRQVKGIVKKMHSDNLPFIGFMEMKGVDKKYWQWMKNEIK